MLLLSIFTAGIFLDIWIIVQALWVKKFDPESNALTVYVAGIAATILAELLNVLHASGGAAGVLLIAALVLVTVASFSVRDSLGRYITSVKGTPTYLSGVMTILFGPIYFQYHMNRIRSFQRAR